MCIAAEGWPCSFTTIDHNVHTTQIQHTGTGYANAVLKNQLGMCVCVRVLVCVWVVCWQMQRCPFLTSRPCTLATGPKSCCAAPCFGQRTASVLTNELSHRQVVDSLCRQMQVRRAEHLSAVRCWAHCCPETEKGFRLLFYYFYYYYHLSEIQQLWRHVERHIYLMISPT